MTSTDARRIDAGIKRIALPATVALATEPLFELCDIAILSSIGTEQLGGASLAIRLLAFGHAVFVFLMFGTTAAVARHLGARDVRGAEQAAVSALWIAAAIGTVSALVFVASGRALLGALGGSGEVAEHAWTYLWINALALPAFTLTMAGVGIYRGRQNARIPLIVSAVASALNLIADLILVVGLGYGVAAAAATTALAKVAAALFYAGSVARQARRNNVALRPRSGEVRSQLNVGRDLAVRTLLLRGAFMAAQSMAAHRGPQQLAGFAITFQVWMFTAYAADGLEAAGQSLVSHELGAASTPHANHRPDLRALIARLMTWGVRLGLMLTVVLIVFANPIASLFSSDPEVVAAASSGLRWVGALSIVNAVAFVGDGILVGAQRQRFLALASAVALGGFCAGAAITSGSDGLGGVWLAISVLMALRCAAAILGVRALTLGRVP